MFFFQADSPIKFMQLSKGSELSAAGDIFEMGLSRALGTDKKKGAADFSSSKLNKVRISLSEDKLAANCIRYFGFLNTLRGGILNSIGFYLTLVLRILFGVGSSSFNEVVIHFFFEK